MNRAFASNISLYQCGYLSFLLTLIVVSLFKGCIVYRSILELLL